MRTEEYATDKEVERVWCREWIRAHRAELGVLGKRFLTDLEKGRIGSAAFQTLQVINTRNPCWPYPNDPAPSPQPHNELTLFERVLKRKFNKGELGHGSNGNAPSKKEKARFAECDRAMKAFDAIGPDDSDAVIAKAIADELMTGVRIMFDGPPYCFFISPIIGPCPIEFDWQGEDAVGIKTRDKERARSWAIEALLLGYSVFRQAQGPRGTGWGWGSIAQVRERRRAR